MKAFFLILLILVSQAATAKGQPYGPPFRFTVLITKTGVGVTGMAVPQKRNEAVQEAIHNDFNEFHRMYSQGDSMRYLVRSPLYGDVNYPPYYLYGCVYGPGVLRVTVSVPDCG